MQNDNLVWLWTFCVQSSGRDSKYFHLEVIHRSRLTQTIILYQQMVLYVPQLRSFLLVLDYENSTTCDVKPCNLADRFHRSGGTYCTQPSPEIKRTAREADYSLRLLQSISTHKAISAFPHICIIFTVWSVVNKRVKFTLTLQWCWGTNSNNWPRQRS